MVCIETKRRMEENLLRNRAAILKESHRFAVVGTDSVQYYDSREELYAEHLGFRPDSPLILGTSPIFVDIGKAQNSLEYRREELEQDMQELQQSETENLRRRNQLEKQQQELIQEEDQS